MTNIKQTKTKTTKTNTKPNTDISGIGPTGTQKMKKYLFKQIYYNFVKKVRVCEFKSRPSPHCPLPTQETEIPLQIDATKNTELPLLT